MANDNRERFSESTYFNILERIFLVLKITFAQDADDPDLSRNSIKTFFARGKINQCSVLHINFSHIHAAI